MGEEIEVLACCAETVADDREIYSVTTLPFAGCKQHDQARHTRVCVAVRIGERMQGSIPG